ncbi:MAG TPA: hypothetical protein DCG12_20755, partial [Planctomycetaceae bacterium]|nr:hypothetical protein [Planctomycetaceae bacterium]
MKNTSKTLVFVGVAAASMLFAWFAHVYSQPGTSDGFADVGKPFFPEFENVLNVAGMRLTDYDVETDDVIRFEVAQNKDKLWVIKSHNDYPAEAESSIAKAATALLGVKKDSRASISKQDWYKYGVIAPDDDDAAEEAKEQLPEDDRDRDIRGIQLTLFDSSENALVDMIVGDQVDGRPGYRYVRQAGSSATFIAELKIDVSAKFTDWIEPDLLKLSSSDVVKMTLDNYSINEGQGLIEKKERLELAKEELDSTKDWQLDGLKEEEALDQSPIKSIPTGLQNLKIVGVRPKPRGLESNLRVQSMLKSELLQGQGFFIGPGDTPDTPQLYGNEGEMRVGTKQGVEYALYFGEVARGSQREIETGLSDGADSKDDAGSGEDATDEGDGEAGDVETAKEGGEDDGPNRYLLVTVNFVEDLLGPKPEPPVEPQMPEILKQKAAEPDAEEADKQQAPEDGDKAADADEGACGLDEEQTDEAKTDEAKTDEAKTDEAKTDEA